MKTAATIAIAITLFVLTAVGLLRHQVEGTEPPAPAKINPGVHCTVTDPRNDKISCD